MPYLTREEPTDETIPCRILTAALELFVEKGYHKVSIHDIQRRSEVSIGSIYNHFGGKEGVARDLYEQLLRELDLVMDEVEASGRDALARCETLIRRMLGYTESHRSIMAFIFGTRHREFLPDQPPLCNSRPFQRMRGLVEAAMQNGQIRQMDGWLAASAVFGGAIRLIQLRLDGLIEHPLPELGDGLIEVTWQGLTPTGAKAGTKRAAAT